MWRRLTIAVRVWWERQFPAGCPNCGGIDPSDPRERAYCSDACLADHMDRTTW